MSIVNSRSLAGGVGMRSGIISIVTTIHGNVRIMGPARKTISKGPLMGEASPREKW